MIAWGIDLGGTKIECAVIKIRGNDFEILHRQRLPTEAHKGYVHILNQIQNLVHDVAQQLKVQPNSLGIATPGILDKQTNCIKNANVTSLNGQNLTEDLKHRLKVPVFHANDANCFALAEARLGAVPAYITNPRVVFGVILGTGVGGGLVINGQIYEGLHGIAGEWGHNYLAPIQTTCYCGQSGCVEQFISGPALENLFLKQSRQKLSLPQIYALHQQEKSSIATQTIAQLRTHFGKAVAAIINTLDPEIIVLGGGVSNIEDLYQDPYNYIGPFLFNPSLHTPIVKNKLGDSAGVFGAALLTTSHTFT
jgi:fructokinase